MLFVKKNICAVCIAKEVAYLMSCLFTTAMSSLFVRHLGGAARGFQRCAGLALGNEKQRRRFCPSSRMMLPLPLKAHSYGIGIEAEHSSNIIWFGLFTLRYLRNWSIYVLRVVCLMYTGTRMFVCLQLCLCKIRICFS